MVAAGPTRAALQVVTHQVPRAGWFEARIVGPDAAAGLVRVAAGQFLQRLVGGPVPCRGAGRDGDAHDARREGVPRHRR